MDIKVGDLVHITDRGQIYSTYWTWPGAREMHTGRGSENNSARWCWAHYILQDIDLDFTTISAKEFVVEWKAEHESQDSMLYLLEEVESGYPVLINEAGIEKAVPTLNGSRAFKYRGYTFYLRECAAGGLVPLNSEGMYVCFARTNHVTAANIDIVPGFWLFSAVSDLDAGAQINSQVLDACDEFINTHPDWLGDPE